MAAGPHALWRQDEIGMISRVLSPRQQTELDFMVMVRVIPFWMILSNTFSGRYLHDNRMWHFKLYATIVMNCNDKPVMSSNKPAVWGKIRVIDFPMKFITNPTL